MAHADDAAARTSAEAPPEDVRPLFERGSEAFRVGAYDDAIQAFTEAYDRSKMPALLFNIAQAQRLKGDCPSALTTYRRYVELAPAASNRGRIETRIQELEGRCGQKDEAKPEQAIGQKTLPEVTPAVPTTSETIVSSPPAKMPASEKALPWSRAEIAGVSLIGIAAAAATVGVIFSWKAANAASRTSELFERGGMWDPEARRVEAEGQRADRTAIVLYSVAGAFGAIGVWSLLKTDTSFLSVTPQVGKRAEMGGAVLEWTSVF